MSYYDNIHKQISELEKIRKDIISALNYVGVSTPANTTYDDLPNYVMKIGGVDTTNWPVDMNSIGYTAEDSRRACYRYMCYKIDNNGDLGFLNINNLKDLINNELQLSVQKLNQWTGNANNFFDSWPGKFPPMLNTRNCTNFEGFLSHTSCVHYPLYDTSNAVQLHGMFHWSDTPHEIPEFDFRNATTFEFGYGGSFWNTYIFSPKNIGVTAPTSYYSMLGMLDAGAPGHWWSPIGQHSSNYVNGGAIITNMINFNPYNIENPYYWNMFEIPPKIIACEGFNNLSTTIDLTSSMEIGDYPALEYGGRLSINSCRNIINGLRDVTHDLYWDGGIHGELQIDGRQNYSNGNIKIRASESEYATGYSWMLGYGYYSDSELSAWEAVHGQASFGSTNYREFLLQTGHMTTPNTSPAYTEPNVPINNWYVDQDSEYVNIPIPSSCTYGHVFVVLLKYNNGFDLNAYMNDNGLIYDYRFSTDINNPLHDSNNEGVVLVGQPEREGHPTLRINELYWNNKLTQTDRDLVLYKGWDVYFPV